MNKINLVKVGGLALSGLGVLLSSIYESKKTEQVIAKEVAKQMATKEK